MTDKIIIYQILTRLFGNTRHNNIPNGTLEQNGSGKFNFFTPKVLEQIKSMGISHIWYTGIIRHATVTDYSSYGIPRQHPAIVKGIAGSPYAITDYYDVDPDLAEDTAHRMDEFDALVQRTHKAGMKVVIDFVPNHVARQYHSIAKPEGTRDLGESDNPYMNFSTSNNFYYCNGLPFTPHFSLKGPDGTSYTECPAKATGNDHFDASPTVNDWYETVKLNYGIDYCDAGGRSEHFSPIPDTWKQMTDILLFWAGKGIDAFRCDMAEMVPAAFWKHATDAVKQAFPHICFIGEVYNPSLYHTYIEAGFNYLYDKVGMYDTLRGIMCQGQSTQTITQAWQRTDDIGQHMLYFLENHDEQRIASSFFAGNADAGIPGIIALALMRKNPVMIYAGQEYGEAGMDTEGFSGQDGRTTIFDYWSISSLYHAYINRSQLTENEKRIRSVYQSVMNIAATERAVSDGDFFDLMYANTQLNDTYVFFRKSGNELLLVASHFSSAEKVVAVNIPQHAFTFLGINAGTYSSLDLLSGESVSFLFGTETPLQLSLPPYGGRVFKIDLKHDIMQNNTLFNNHLKDEFPPAHTAEHLLNQTMIQMFGCSRSDNAHIERKKSKMSFVLDHKPTRKEEKEIEARMNQLIADDLPVTYEIVDKDDLPSSIDRNRLPAEASKKIRLVHIGKYDVCPCIGKHVRSTSQIGRFVLLGTNWDEASHTFRVRFKIV